MSPSPSLRPRRGVAALLIALVLLVAAAVPATAADQTGAARRVLAVQWQPCGSLQCATLKVPLDYSKPDGVQIELALARAKTAKKGQRVGSLLVNPGGPGASGVELVQEAPSFFPKQLLDHFDIVGWDPRGTGSSTPVQCLDDLSEVFATDYSPDSPSEQRKMEDVSRKVALACGQRSGDVLPYLSSQNTARDMDRIRRAVGDKKMNYLGYSYGTYLGALYANAFPKKVRAMVLDGAVDPSLPPEESVIQQAEGFENALAAFFENCGANPQCAFYSDGNPEAAYDKLAARVDRSPISAQGAGRGRRLGPGEFDLGVAMALYSGTPGWPTLAEVLAEAERGDGSTLMRLADEYVGRQPDGTYDHSQPAFWSIGCLDTPLPSKGFQELAFRAALKSPHFGPATANLGLVCQYWPVQSATQPGPIHAVGSPAILVLGTTGDPATPLSWAKSLADQLDKGRLVTQEGEAHTAFPAGTRCLDNGVVDYLVKLKLPKPNLLCR